VLRVESDAEVEIEGLAVISRAKKRPSRSAVMRRTISPRIQP
jgi:hypothetical protein